MACAIGSLGYHASRVTASTSTTNERRGPVLEVLEELLAGGDTDAVIALFRKLVARNADLEKRLADALSRGHKNEGVSTAQLLLLLNELAAAPVAELDTANQQLRQASGIDAKREEEAEKPRPQPRLRLPLPPGLRRVENVIPVPQEERACPRCGRERQCIGHDVSEVLDLVPAEVIVRLDKREKRACLECEAEVVRAPLGDKVVAGGRMGTTLVSQLLADKYWDGLPLHRQKQRFERLGVKIPVQTLSDQVAWATDLLRPVWRASMDAVLAAVIMHLDATSLPVLDDSKAGGLKLGSLWGYVGDEETALYLYASTGKKHGQREGELGPADMLAKRKGYTVADAAGIFDESFKQPGIVECGCNMHARRYFQKALDRGDARAALPLAAFKKLYAIEDEIRDRDALVAALGDLGFHEIEVHDHPQRLVGYEDDLRPEKAEIIIRRRHLSDVSNDIGFRKTKTGAFEAVVSDYDVDAGFGKDWRNKLMQRYGRHVAVAKLARKGFRVMREELRDGKLHLVMGRTR